MAPDDRVAGLEDRLVDVEHAAGEVHSRVAVLEATVPLQFQQINQGIVNLQDLWKLDRETARAQAEKVSADMEALKKDIQGLQLRPGLLALGGWRAVAIAVAGSLATGFIGGGLRGCVPPVPHYPPAAVQGR